MWYEKQEQAFEVGFRDSSPLTDRARLRKTIRIENNKE